jgi:hypothetical protein
LKITYIKILALLFFALVHILISENLVIADISPTERAALIALYNSTGGDNWTDNSGWKSEPLDDDDFAMPGTEDTWYGITCDDDNTTVLDINLFNNQLTGSIPLELGNLENLITLWLPSNQLTGPIPEELGNLTGLKSLYLYRNQLTGPIPGELGDLNSLLNLNLHYNNLTGSIPSELGNLANIEELYLYRNQLTGSIPPELGNLNNIRVLILDYNQLTGSIPPELGNLNNMITLSLINNQFTNEIPKELGNLTNLTSLNLSDNQLSGEIPKELGNLTNMTNLYLSDNQLSGIIPVEMMGMISLIYLEICDNHLYATDLDLKDFLNNLQPGWEDCQLDNCPDDPDKMIPGICGCGVADTDSDEDGTADCNDNCPDDHFKTDPGICGCGVLDIDSDDDGMMNCIDTDDDNDGLADGDEVSTYGTDPTKSDTDGDGDSDYDEVKYGSDPNLITDTLDNHRPVKPVIETATTDVSLRYHVFSVNEFSDPDSDTLTSSEWQISTDADFTDAGIILNKTLEIGTGILVEETNLLLLTMRELIFLPDENYLIRVRHQDSTGLWSSWSDVVSFTTAIEDPDDIDGNGVDDSYQVDSSTDTNGNGVNDSEEGILATSDAEQGETVGVGIDKGSISGLTSLSTSDLPAEVIPDDPMPYGLFSFRIDGLTQGETVDIDFYFPDDIPPDIKWYKYDSADGTLIDYTDNIIVDGNKVAVSVTDGELGDIDDTENGIIIDPSGPSFTVTSEDGTDTIDDGSSSGGTSRSSRGGGGDSGCFIATAAY